MDPLGIFGMKIVVSDAALSETEERLFPASKNRSRRVHKKLVKRFGGEFKMVPTVFRFGRKLVCHPSLYCKLCAALEAHDDGK